MEILYEQKIPFISLKHRFRNDISGVTNDTGRQKYQLTGWSVYFADITHLAVAFCVIYR
jgi:hypothetical protein